MITEKRILKVRLEQKASSRTCGNTCMGEKSSSVGSSCLLVSRSTVSTPPQVFNPTPNLGDNMSLYREINGRVKGKSGF